MPEGEHGGVVQYDLGKETDAGFQRKGFLSAPPPRLRSAVQVMRSDHVFGKTQMNKLITASLRRTTGFAAFQRPGADSVVLFPTSYQRQRNTASCACCDRSKAVSRPPRSKPEISEIHYGPIASGYSVIKAAARRSDHEGDLGDVLCIEMEAAGLQGQYSGIVIRGISDYADSHKKDDWRYFAALAEAVWMKELLSYLDPEVKPTASLTPASVHGHGHGPYNSVCNGTGISNVGSGNFHVGGNVHIK